jgi:hypothetical protein
MSTKDYFQQVPNATSFQVLDHVTWNNNVTMRLNYFQPLVNGSAQRIKLSFSQSIASSTAESLIGVNSYTVVEANTTMWNGTQERIYLPIDGLYVISTTHSFNGIGGRRLLNVRFFDYFGSQYKNRALFYENIVSGDIKSFDVIENSLNGGFVINGFSGHSIDLRVLQNSGGPLTVSGTVHVQKMSEIFEI